MVTSSSLCYGKTVTAFCQHSHIPHHCYHMPLLPAHYQTTCKYVTDTTAHHVTFRSYRWRTEWTTMFLLYTYCSNSSCIIFYLKFTNPSSNGKATC